MSIKWREMVSGAVLEAIPSEKYAAPALTSASIQAVSVYNPTATAVVLDLYRAPEGMVADNTTKICSRSVAPGAVVQAHEAINHKFEAGSRLLASGTGLILNVSGVEYLPGT